MHPIQARAGDRRSQLTRGSTRRAFASSDRLSRAQLSRCVSFSGWSPGSHLPQLSAYQTCCLLFRDTNAFLFWLFTFFHYKDPFIPLSTSEMAKAVPFLWTKALYSQVFCTLSRYRFAGWYSPLMVLGLFAYSFPFP